MESFTVGDEESPDIHNATLFIFAVDHIASKSHFIKPKMNFGPQFDATQQRLKLIVYLLSGWQGLLGSVRSRVTRVRLTI